MLYVTSRRNASMGVSLRGAEREFSTRCDELDSPLGAIVQNAYANRRSQVPKAQRRRPTEVERRRLSRPHDGTFVSLLRTPAPTVNSTAAHPTHDAARHTTVDVA